MNTQKNYKKGMRNEIVKIMHVCGMIPLNSFDLLKGKKREYLKRINQMREEGVVQIERTPGFRTARFKDYEKHQKELSENISPVYYNEYKANGSRALGAFKYEEKGHSIRMYRSAQVTMFMYGTNCKTMPDEKPVLEMAEERTGECYYNSIEIKQQTGFKASRVSVNKILANSRLYGMYLTNNRVYGIYHTGRGIMNWIGAGEHRMVLHINKMLGKSEEIELEDAILLSKKMEDYKVLIDIEKNKEQEKILSLEDCYKRIYLLPLDKNGQKMIEVMKEKNWEEKMYQEMLPEGRESVKSGIVCDSKKDGMYKFIFCIPNIKRLRLFLRAANIYQEEKFVIMCFDYQVEMLKSLVGPNVKILSAPFSKY